VDIQFAEELACIRRNGKPNAQLTGLQLGPQGINELCEALACNSCVKALELDRNRIGDDGAARLAEAFASDSVINFVDLTDNGIGDRGAIALASRLGGNCILSHLDLTRNEILGDGGMAFGRMLTVNSGIRQLTLCGNMVGAGGARSIGLALPSNISLRILNLRYCGLGAEGARYIAQGLSKERAALTELHVGLNQVGDEGAAEFAEMIRINRSILEFYAEANGIKSRGGGLLAEALRDNDCLLKLWLLKNDLGADAVGKFALAVTHNKVLRCLGLTSFDALPPSVRQDMETAKELRTREYAENEDIAPLPVLTDACSPAADTARSGNAYSNDEPRVLHSSSVGSLEMRHATSGEGASRGGRRAGHEEAAARRGRRGRSGSPVNACAAEEGVPQPEFPRASRAPTAPHTPQKPVLEAAVQSGSPGAARQGSAQKEKMEQQIVMWDDQFEIQSLLEMASEFDAVNSTVPIAPVDLAEDGPEVAHVSEELAGRHRGTAPQSEASTS